MTRPDPRLLVPVSCVPIVPEGARVYGTPEYPWSDADAVGVVSRRHGGAYFVAWSDGGNVMHGRTLSPDLLLDLSAPAKRDGLDERLDVLPWALRVLDADAVGVADHRRSVWGNWTLYDAHGATVETIDPSIAGDLSNLTPDERARAVVCAALRARGGSNG